MSLIYVKMLYLFYFTNQSCMLKPMTIEQVMSNEDSENETDDYALDLNERLVIFIYFLAFS